MTFRMGTETVKVQVHQVLQLRKHISWLRTQAGFSFASYLLDGLGLQWKAPVRSRFLSCIARASRPCTCSAYHVRLILLTLRCLHLSRSSYGFRLDWKATPTGAHPDASPCFHPFLKQCNTIWTKTVVQGKRHCLYSPCFHAPTLTYYFERFKTYRKGEKMPLIIPIISLELCEFWSRIQSKPQTAFNCHLPPVSSSPQQRSHLFLSPMTLVKDPGWLSDRQSTDLNEPVSLD